MLLESSPCLENVTVSSECGTSGGRILLVIVPHFFACGSYLSQRLETHFAGEGHIHI